MGQQPRGQQPEACQAGSPSFANECGTEGGIPDEVRVAQQDCRRTCRQAVPERCAACRPATERTVCAYRREHFANEGRLAVEAPNRRELDHLTFEGRIAVDAPIADGTDDGGRHGEEVSHERHGGKPQQGGEVFPVLVVVCSMGWGIGGRADERGTPSSGL